MRFDPRPCPDSRALIVTRQELLVIGVEKFVEHSKSRRTHFRCLTDPDFGKQWVLQFQARRQFLFVSTGELGANIRWHLLPSFFATVLDPGSY